MLCVTKCIRVDKIIDDLSSLRQKVTATEEDIGAQTTGVDQQIDLYYEVLHQQLHQQRELKGSFKKCLYGRRKQFHSSWNNWNILKHSWRV